MVRFTSSRLGSNPRVAAAWRVESTSLRLRLMYSGATHDSFASDPVLSDRGFQLSYCTGHDDLVRDFFVPAMERADLYRRAAGYFTSAGLALAARGVASLASRDERSTLLA